jgi:hypothetical protein
VNIIADREAEQQYLDAKLKKQEDSFQRCYANFVQERQAKEAPGGRIPVTGRWASRLTTTANASADVVGNLIKRKSNKKQTPQPAPSPLEPRPSPPSDQRLRVKLDSFTWQVRALQRDKERTTGTSLANGLQQQEEEQATPPAEQLTTDDDEEQQQMVTEPAKSPSPIPGPSSKQNPTDASVQQPLGSIFGRVPEAGEPPVRLQQREHPMSHWSLDSQCFHADCQPTTIGDVLGPRAGEWAICTLHSPLQAMAIKVLDEVSHGGAPLSLIQQVIQSTPAQLAQALVGGGGGALGAVIRPINEKVVKLTVGWWKWKCRVASQQLGTPGLHLYPPIYLAAMTPVGEKLSDSWARAVTEVRAQHVRPDIVPEVVRANTILFGTAAIVHLAKRIRGLHAREVGEPSCPIWPAGRIVLAPTVRTVIFALDYLLPNIRAKDWQQLIDIRADVVFLQSTNRFETTPFRTKVVQDNSGLLTALLQLI